MYRCTIVTVATYPHIHTHPNVYVHARRVGDVRRSRFVVYITIQHYISNVTFILLLRI